MRLELTKLHDLGLRQYRPPGRMDPAKKYPKWGGGESFDPWGRDGRGGGRGGRSVVRGENRDGYDYYVGCSSLFCHVCTLMLPIPLPFLPLLNPHRLLPSVCTPCDVMQCHAVSCHDISCNVVWCLRCHVKSCGVMSKWTRGPVVQTETEAICCFPRDCRVSSCRRVAVRAVVRVVHQAGADMGSIRGRGGAHA